MKQIECPNCHKAFTLDEANYAAIVSQVRNVEFQKELEQRLAEVKETQQALQAAQQARTQEAVQKKLNEKSLEISQKDAEITRLTEQLKSVANAEQVKFDEKLAEKERL